MESTHKSQDANQPETTDTPEAPTRFKSQTAKRKAADLLAKGVPIKHALIEAGYSEKTANKGKRGISKGILAELEAQGGNIKDLGYKMLRDPESMHAIAVGRAAYASLTGSDKGVAAARLLGSHKAVDAWRGEEKQTNLVVVQPPEWAMSRLLEKLAPAPVPAADPE